MVGILVSFWDGLFSGDMLVLGSVFGYSWQNFGKIVTCNFTQRPQWTSAGASYRVVPGCVCSIRCRALSMQAAHIRYISQHDMSSQNILHTCKPLIENRNQIPKIVSEQRICIQFLFSSFFSLKQIAKSSISP